MVQKRGEGGLNSLCGIKKWTVLRKKNTEKRVGSLLTYDTTLQVVSGTAQEDLFLNLGFLGSHFIGFLLLAGVEATGGKCEVGGGAKAEAGAGRARGKSRTSCGSIDDTKEENGGDGARRDDGRPTMSVGKVNGFELEKERKGVAGLDREEVELRCHRSFLLALLDRPREGEALYYVRATSSTQIGR